MIEIATSVWKTVVLPLKLYPQIDWIVEDSNFSFPRSNAGYPTTRWTIQNRENDLWRRLVTIQPRLICVREFYRLLSSPLLSASTNHSLKSRDSVDFTIATDKSAKRSAVPTLLLFVIHAINVNSWSGWGISKSQPLASKASRLPLTIHPDIWYPEMVTLHRQTIISRPFFY